ncbi:MAG: 50S ribosomal protein L25 [Candidatus Zambryskibacteria bacterium]|nr:50S ribosomal protein L25 [Candidatus Zambryskibacteria bacterium]
MLTLKADIRNTSTKPADVRKAGQIPAVFYGKKEASTPISIPKIDFLKVWKEAGESSVITLNTPDGEKETFIKDVDIDPVSGAPRHADFYVFEAGHKVEVSLPIEFEGVSPAVKDLGGTLVKVLYEINVEAMPKDLPHNIIVDISTLAQFGDQILAQDLILPTGVELKIDSEDVVATVSAPREEKEEEAAPIDLESIKVEKKGKDEDAEGEGEAAESEEKKEDK